MSATRVWFTGDPIWHQCLFGRDWNQVTKLGKGIFANKMYKVSTLYTRNNVGRRELPAALWKNDGQIWHEKGLEWTSGNKNKKNYSSLILFVQSVIIEYTIDKVKTTRFIWYTLQMNPVFIYLFCFCKTVQPTHIHVRNNCYNMIMKGSLFWFWWPSLTFYWECKWHNVKCLHAN